MSRILKITYTCAGTCTCALVFVLVAVLVNVLTLVFALVLGLVPFLVLAPHLPTSNPSCPNSSVVDR